MKMQKQLEVLSKKRNSKWKRLKQFIDYIEEEKLQKKIKKCGHSYFGAEEQEIEKAKMHCLWCKSFFEGLSWI